MAPAAWPLLVGLLSPVDTRELHHLEPEFGWCQCAARLRFAAGASGRRGRPSERRASLGFESTALIVVSPVVLGPKLLAKGAGAMPSFPPTRTLVEFGQGALLPAT